MCVTDAHRQAMIRSGSPLGGAPATSRRRIADDPPERLIWNRILSDNKEYEDVRTKLCPDRQVFHNMMAAYDKDEEIKTQVTTERLIAIKRNLQLHAWNQLQFYAQKEIATFPQSYGGCRRIGRSYGGFMQNLKNKCLNTLYHDTHKDLDIVNSRPSMLFNVGRHLPLSGLSRIVVSRDAVYSEFRRKGVSKSQVKDAIYKTISASPKFPSFNISPEIDRLLGEDALLLDLHKDLITIAQDVKEFYGDFWNGMVEHSRIDGKDMDHINGIILTKIADDMEDSVTRMIVETLRGEFNDDLAHHMILKFDGLVTPKTTVHDPDKIVDLQNSINDHLGIEVRLAFKEMEDRYEGCDPVFQVDPYLKEKSIFELSFAKVNTPALYLYTSNGEYSLKKKADFEHLTMEVDQDFLKQWKQDATKKVFEGLDFCPPPRRPKAGYYNTFQGYAGDRIEVDPDPHAARRDVELFKDHVNDLCGRNESSLLWMMNWIAWIIQKPSEKTKVIPYFISLQGCGKDLLFSLIGKMVGSSLSAGWATCKSMFEEWSICLYGKVFVHISESNIKDFQDPRILSEMKQWATRDDFQVRQKGVDPWKADCFLNIAMGTNCFETIPDYNLDVRRFVLFTSNAENAQNTTHFKPLFAMLQRPSSIKALYDHLKTLDISKWNPFEHRPITETMVEMSTSTNEDNALIFMLQDRLAEWESDARGCRSRDPIHFRSGDKNLLFVCNANLQDAMSMRFQGTKIQDNPNAQKKIIRTQLLSLNSTLERFKTGDAPDKLVDQKYNPPRMKGPVFHLPSLKNYLATFGPREEGGDDNGMAVGFFP